MEHGKVRSENTNKHDRARLLHLYKDPRAQMAWTGAYNPLSRKDLDSPARTSQYFDTLASMFNDYKSYTYQNAVVKYDLRTGRPMDPLVPVLPTMTNLMNHTHELNPADPTRPRRSGAWVKETWGMMKKQISLAFAKFTASGQQDAANKYNSWLGFTQPHGGDVTSYSMAVLEVIIRLYLPTL